MAKFFPANHKLQSTPSTCYQVSTIELDAWFNSSVKSFDYIPKIIHQSWKNTKLRERQARWAQTWCDQYTGWYYHLWTDQENEQFVQSKFPWFYSTYISLEPAILQADSVRYLYMFYYGGLYVDLDYESLQRIDDLLVNKHVVLSPINYQFQHTEYSVPNSWMASRPRHHFWMFVIHRIMILWEHRSNENDQVGYWGGKAEFFTGPQTLFHSLMLYLHWNQNTNAGLNEILGNSALQQPDAILQVGDVTFLGPKLVHANDWILGIHADVCSLEVPTFNDSACKILQQPIYSITYWSHSYRPNHLSDPNYLRDVPNLTVPASKEKSQRSNQTGILQLLLTVDETETAE